MGPDQNTPDETPVVEPLPVQPAPQTPQFFEPKLVPNDSGQVVPPVQQNQIPQTDQLPPRNVDIPPIVNSPTGYSYGPQPKFSKKKKLLFIGSVLAILAIACGLVFGLYLPTTPNSVWNTGINRSGKALDSLVISATDPKKLESYKTSEISGTVDAKIQEVTYKGDFTTTFDQTSLDGGLNFTVKDTTDAVKTFNAKVLSEIPSGSNFPNIFFQLNGLKTLGIDAYMPGISDYDGKWIVVSSTYLKSIGANYLSSTDNNSKQLTSADIAEMARASSSVTKDYLFNTATDKAVFVKQSFVGKETVDSVSTYHYKVGVNVQHAKDYCVALTDSVMSTKAYKKLAGSDSSTLAEDKKASAKSCQTGLEDTFKASDSYDLWIDAKYKLIYKIRANDPEDKGKYTEVGQLYQGGDKLSLFVNYHDTKAKSDGKFTLDTDLKSSSTKGTLTFIGASEDNPYNVKLTLTAKIASKAVKITPPSNPVPIQEILEKLGLASSATTQTNSSSTSPLANTPIGLKSQDTERQIDIRSLQGQIEAYYAGYGGYPSLAEVNDSTWRNDNMQGLDNEALKDPSGKTATLGSSATATQYGYAPSDCTEANYCQKYTLTAMLSSGSLFTVTSLN